MRSKPTYGIWLDTRRALQNSKYPLRIRITYQRETKYFPILESKYAPLEFSTMEWELIRKGNPRGSMRDVQLEIVSIEDKVKDLVNSITFFTFDKFSDLLLGKKIAISDTTLNSILKARSDNYKSQGRISTSANATSILKSFKAFFKEKGIERDIEIDEVNPKSLKEYQTWMLAKGKSMATIGIYTREIRVMFNELIAEGAINRDSYPFGIGKFQPPKAEKVKYAIYKAETSKIMKYKANELNKEAFSRDLWIFSYLCSGINMRDIVSLKYANISGGCISFVREKTVKSNRTRKMITVPMTEKTIEIIERWGNENKKDNFIFPILDGTENPEDIRRKVSNMNRLVSDTIKRIAKVLKINDKIITAVSARDAFATVSLMQGRPLSDISESLGHSTIAVTQHYFAKITSKDKLKWQKKLM